MITNQANIEHRGNGVKVIISTIGKRGPQGPPGEGMYSFDTLQEAQDKWASFSQEEKDELEGREYVIGDGVYRWTDSQPVEGDFVREVDNFSNSMLLNEIYGVESASVNQDGIISSASIVWDDGTEGTLTFDDYNDEWMAYDSYTVTYEDKTLTQPKVTRDENGTIINQPLKTIS